MNLEQMYAEVKEEGFSWREAVLMTDLQVVELTKEEADEVWKDSPNDPVWRKRYGV